MSKHKTKKEILEDLKKDFPRKDFDGFLYFMICNEACNSVEHNRKKLKELTEKLKLLTTESRDCWMVIFKQEAVAITFAAMCLEACIWDYAACNTSQNKAEENFGSLNLVAKWVVIPQLLCGSDITKRRIGGTCLLGRLRKLKEARNDLVHPKSEPLPDNYNDAIKAIIRKPKKITAEDAFGLIGLLLGELEKVDKTNWWFFQTDFVKKLHKSSAS